MKILTISIASYNIEKFINNTLNSLIDERIINDIEVLIVNDGSKDNTVKLAKKYVEKYPDSFFIIDKENGGYGSTINASMPVATGKYYKLLDGDDWYNTENLVEIIDILKKSNEDLIVMPHIEIIDETQEQTIKKPLPEEWENKSFTFKDYPTGNRLCMHQVCFKTSAIQKQNIKITEHCFYTDAEYLLKSMSKCKTIKYIPIPLYMYRIGLDEQSMSVKGMRKHYKDAVTYYSEMLRYRKEERINQDYYDNYLTDAMVSLAKYHLNMFFLLPINKKKEYESFENKIKEEAPDIYKLATTRTISTLRKSKNLLYIPMCWWGRLKARKAIRV